MMEKDVTEIRTLLSSPDTLPSPREESLKVCVDRIQSLRTTIAEIQSCKPGLCLPEKAEETLTVFQRVDQLQQQLEELEKMVPGEFIVKKQTLTLPPVKVPAPSPTVPTSSTENVSVPSSTLPATEEADENGVKQGQIQIVHVEEDALKSSPEQRLSWGTEKSRDPEVAAEGSHAAAEEEGGTTAMEQSQDTTEQVPDTSIYGTASSYVAKLKKREINPAK
ncbi:unnamed protein product [Oncorhynchus mykiss]|uniref:Uncharacterized protein n=1 Tax=Oncorhynchus mykiss TaxID=8022 RepID=A0A060VMU4_ONCMY|nr:unnamed protein product [Oncorhynchus mykiss]